MCYNHYVYMKFQLQINGYVKCHIKNMRCIKYPKFLQNLGEPTKFILIGYSYTILWLWMLGTHLSLQRYGYDSRPVHMGFVVELVENGEVFLQILWFSPVSIIPPLLNTHISLIYNWHHTILATGIVISL